mmetsp:Transcript_3495/g.3314  ORF Transcript_3495/g.3314 Transcript_3495/m.3314 type:complete len:127 (+) Transcript_3495:62-442(+)
MDVIYIHRRSFQTVVIVVLRRSAWFSLVLMYDKKLIQTVNSLREDIGFKKFDNDRKDCNFHLKQLLAMSITAKFLRLSISLKKIHSCENYNHCFTFLTAIKKHRSVLYQKKDTHGHETKSHMFPMT